MLFTDHRYDVDPQLAHRRAEATVTVTTAGGVSLTDAEVTVAQRDHRFLFGCIGFDFVALVGDASPGEPLAGAGDGAAGGPGAGSDSEALQRLTEQWFGLFNFATLPFYWARFEPQRGEPDTQRLLATARWFVDRGVAVKGHPLTWHTLAPDWLLGLTNDQVLDALRARIQRDVTDLAGTIDMWDAINEAVIMPVFDKEDNGITRACRGIGRIGMVATSFEQARAANPNATLLLNDFDMSTAFECLIEGVLEAGIEVDAIGLQSHMHQGYWGEERTLSILERFARYGLPIHFTETTIVSGHLMPPEIVDLNDYRIADWPSTPEHEERQADEVVRHYRTLVSHPAVEAVTYWGLSDEGAWLGAPAGLVRADGTVKPAYEALQRLIRDEWWVSPTTLRTDDRGRVRFTGHLGDYDLNAHGRTARFSLERAGEVVVPVTLGN